MPVKQEQTQKPKLNFNPEWSNFFKSNDSRKEMVTHTYTRTVIWLVENGEKVKQVSDSTNTNTTSDVLYHGNPKTFDDFVDKDAIDYAESIVISYNEKKPESYGSQELWEQMIYNQLMRQTLNYNGKVLTTLKGKEMDWCVKLADDMLGKLTLYLLEQYGKSDDRQKQIFKERISKSFSNASILADIKNKENIV